MINLFSLVSLKYYLLVKMPIFSYKDDKESICKIKRNARHLVLVACFSSSFQTSNDVLSLVGEKKPQKTNKKQYKHPLSKSLLSIQAFQ